MSVPAGMRGEPKLAVFTKANALAKYTMKITSNPNNFDPTYSMLIRRINDAAIGIAQDAWSANNIVVKKSGVIDPVNARKRFALQERAARHCNDLLFLINLSQSVFHLRSKRVKYWTEQAVDVRNLIRRWRDSDRRRYGL